MQRISLTSSLWCVYAELRVQILEWQLKAESRAGKYHSPDDREQLREQLVKKLLRKIPYWSAGHLRLATRALDRNDLALAFASAQAARTVAATSAAQVEATRILARCQLKAGEYESARSTLVALRETSPQSWAVREDVAALMIHQGDYRAAAVELGAIPEQDLSAEGRAALEFVKGKVAAG